MATTQVEGASVLLDLIEGGSALLTWAHANMRPFTAARHTAYSCIGYHPMSIADLRKALHVEYLR